MQGYDCDDPRGLQDVTYSRGEACIEKMKVRHLRNATIHVLQKLEYEKKTGVSCAVAMTRQVQYCGSSDHMTMYNRLTQTAVPSLISVEDCKTMATRRAYQVPDGRTVDLVMNSVVQVNYELIGRTFVDSDGEVECIGASYSYEGEWFTNVVVHVQATITLQEEKFLIDTDSVKVSSKGLILPCEPHEIGCETPHATYIWKGRDPLGCRTALTKTTSGVIAYTDDEKEVFMSTDGELVRLILGSSITTCRTIVRETNYERLLAYEGSSPVFLDRTPVSYTHLTLPTIYSV